MFKNIKNTKSGVIHAAYGSNVPCSLCGLISPDSKDIEVLEYNLVTFRNKAITCDHCLNGTRVGPKGIMNILKACNDNIRENITTFILNCPDCENMITERMEPTHRCRHVANKVKTCEWVFCPLRRSI